MQGRRACATTRRTTWQSVAAARSSTSGPAARFGPPSSAPDAEQASLRASQPGGLAISLCPVSWFRTAWCRGAQRRAAAAGVRLLEGRAAPPHAVTRGGARARQRLRRRDRAGANLGRAPGRGRYPELPRRRRNQGAVPARTRGDLSGVCERDRLPREPRVTLPHRRHPGPQWGQLPPLVTGRSSIPRPLPCHDVLLSLILFGLLNTETPHRAASSAHQALSDPGHRARTPAGLDAPSIRGWKK